MPIIMKPKFNAFITMSPGHAGCAELPDLAALFRFVVMMVADYALIGRSMFYAFVLADAQVFMFLSGLVFSGVWCCFDEFNGMYIEVLSVIAQQLLVLFRWTADMKYYNDTATLVFEGTLMRVTMKPTLNVSITSNPGYVGRAKLPVKPTA
eukprot:2245238-Amphidinium_carterae.1